MEESGRKKNCYAKILYLVKICFKNEGERDFFRHTKAERIHHQQNKPTGIEKDLQARENHMTRNLGSMPWREEHCKGQICGKIGKTALFFLSSLKTTACLKRK